MGSEIHRYSNQAQITLRREEHVERKRWYLIVQFYHVLAPKRCVILRHWGSRGFPPWERAATGPGARQQSVSADPSAKQPGRVSGPPAQPGVPCAHPGSPTEETNEHTPGSGGQRRSEGRGARSGSSGARVLGAQLLKWKPPKRPQTLRATAKRANAGVCLSVSTLLKSQGRRSARPAAAGLTRPVPFRPLPAPARARAGPAARTPRSLTAPGGPASAAARSPRRPSLGPAAQPGLPGGGARRRGPRRAGTAPV